MVALLFVVILAIIRKAYYIDAFSPYSVCHSPVRSICSNSKEYRSIKVAATAVQPFNPFTARNKNSKVKWFETDLETFYDYVETQKLLTAEQELQYGKAMRMWYQIEQMRDYLQSQHKPDYQVQNNELAEAMGCSIATLEKTSRYAEISKNQLVSCNLKLVLAVVSRYRSSAIPNAELIAEGTRGLARAALRYDYSKGFRFATYATWYVHQAIADYVRWRKHPAKMPSRYLMLFKKVKLFSAQYKLERSRLPTISEIAVGLKQPQFDIIKVLSMQQYPTLLGTPVKSKYSTTKYEGKERTLEDMLPSAFKAPLAHAGSRDLRRDMEKMMQVNLNDVERDILRLRLGLDDGRAKPIKEVGKRFHISWKQVRSVEKLALAKLMRSPEIKDFVQNYHDL